MTIYHNKHRRDVFDRRRRKPKVSFAGMLLSVLLISTLCATFAEGRTISETKRGIRGMINDNSTGNNAKSQRDNLRNHRTQRRLPDATSESGLADGVDDPAANNAKKSKHDKEGVDKGGIYDKSDEYYDQYYGSTGESTTSDNSGSEIDVSEGSSLSSSSNNGKDNTSKSGAESIPGSSSKDDPPTVSPVVSAPTLAPFINDLLNSSKNNNNNNSSEESPPTPSPKGSETRAPSIFNTDDTSNNSEESDASSTNNDATSDDGTAGDGVGDNYDIIVISNTEICLAVSSKQPRDAQDSTTSAEFSISVDVVYQTETISSSTIESQLEEQNIAMALWIAGCREAEAINNSTVVDMGNRRGLQVDLSATPFIIYSEVESWQTAGPCKENVFVDSLLEASSPLCQQEFTSTIQIQTDGSDASSESLMNQITESFDVITKSFIESQQGVVAIAIEEISEEDQDNSDQEPEIEQIIQGDKNESKVRDNDKRTTIIIACSIVGGSVFVCILCLVLIFVYEKRRKEYGHGGRDGLCHLPFNNDDEKPGNAGAGNINKISRNQTSEESDSDDEGGDSIFDDSFADYPPPPPPELVSPCHNTPDSRIPAPFDECVRAGKVCSAATCQKCETQRQEGLDRIRRKITLASLIKSIDSSAPASVPMDTSPITMTTPRKERLPLTADIYERPYGVEDMVEL